MKRKKRKFKKHPHLSYIDSVSSSEADLMMVASLCQAATDDVIDGAETLHWIGDMIEKHLNENRLRRKKHFDEPIDFKTKVFLEDELERLNVKSKKKKRGKK